MHAIYSEGFQKSYEDAPVAIKHAFKRRVPLLLANLRHPSLHAKKYDEERDIWQARVNKSWRFYFMIVGDTYRLLDITAHPN